MDIIDNYNKLMWMMIFTYVNTTSNSDIRSYYYINGTVTIIITMVAM